MKEREATAVHQQGNRKPHSDRIESTGPCIVYTLLYALCACILTLLNGQGE